VSLVAIAAQKYNITYHVRIDFSSGKIFLLNSILACCSSSSVGGDAVGAPHPPIPSPPRPFAKSGTIDVGPDPALRGGSTTGAVDGDDDVSGSTVDSGGFDGVEASDDVPSTVELA
jgi:hypothetical protein